MEPRRPTARTWPGYAATIAVVALATLFGVVARAKLAAPDFVMAYLLGIALVAARYGRGPSLLASGLSVLAYDFFFVPPFHTLAVDEARHLLTFATMFGTGLVTSALMLRLRQHQADAIEREQRTRELYSLTRDLAAASEVDQAVNALAAHAVSTFGGEAEVLLVTATGALERSARAGQRAPADADRDPTALGRRVRAVIASRDQTFGTLVVDAGMELDPGHRQLLDAFGAQTALALERFRAADAARAAELRARTEQMRSSLLSAVSHDLRTPLAAITGAASTLRDASASLAPEQRAELLDTVCQEAERLERFVANLLEMTRVQAGALAVKREWVPLEELVGSALTRLEPRLAGRPIRAELPRELPLLSVDPVLFEQVLFNLLDNAAKHTPPGTAIEISASTEEGRLVVVIRDRGPGLIPGTEERVFEKFFRGASGGVPGAGLGLAIARGIARAHGGEITARSHPEGGAEFVVTVPVPEAPPKMPLEPEPAHGGPG